MLAICLPSRALASILVATVGLAWMTGGGSTGARRVRRDLFRAMLGFSEASLVVDGRASVPDGSSLRVWRIQKPVVFAVRVQVTGGRCVFRW
jgi:hypothetical protein